MHTIDEVKMTEREAFRIVQPLIQGYTEGIYWDFKKGLSEEHIPAIIKDILAFSNSNYDGDSYIIVGVGEGKKAAQEKVQLTTEDRRRLNTDANYLYLPGKWDLSGLSAEDLGKMKQFSAKLTEKLEVCMMISHPKCEFVPIQISKNRWIYLIIVKKAHGVFISNQDLKDGYNENKFAVRQGVIYVRIADSTMGAKNGVATATECIRVWKNYIDWLEKENQENE